MMFFVTLKSNAYRGLMRFLTCIDQHTFEGFGVILIYIWTHVDTLDCYPDPTLKTVETKWMYKALPVKNYFIEGFLMSSLLRLNFTFPTLIFPTESPL